MNKINKKKMAFAFEVLKDVENYYINNKYRLFYIPKTSEFLVTGGGYVYYDYWEDLRDEMMENMKIIINNYYEEMKEILILASRKKTIIRNNVNIFCQRHTNVNVCRPSLINFSFYWKEYRFSKKYNKDKSIHYQSCAKKMKIFREKKKLCNDIYNIIGSYLCKTYGYNI